jgi:hypothetical protein
MAHRGNRQLVEAFARAQQYRAPVVSLTPTQAVPPGPVAFGLPSDAVVALPAAGQVLYRLASNPLEESDFVSLAHRGKPPFKKRPMLMHAGLSMFEQIAQAKSRSNRSPVVVAEVRLDPGFQFYLAKTYGIGHYTVWGLRADLLRVSKVALVA